jgi:2'-5' RNA ligase
VKSGVFVVAELSGSAAEQVLAVQRWADPRMAAGTPPHITLAGSSGAGPMPASTPAALIRELVEPITNDTAPITVRFERPHRFMQTDIVVLPVDPHGPIRTLHERIANSGLRFERPRFAFSPHATLSFFPRLTADMERRLMAVRVGEAVVLSSVQFYVQVEPSAPKLLLELRLTGAGSGTRDAPRDAKRKGDKA